MSPVKPIPDGYNTVSAYLVVPDAEQAIDFYVLHFNARKIYSLPFPDGTGILHGSIQIGDSTVMLMDERPEFGLKSAKTLGGTPISLHIYTETAEALFKEAVDAGCEVLLPIQDTFWGDRFGKVRDPFGIEWSFGTHVEDLSPEEIEKRMKEHAAAGWNEAE